MPPRRDRLVALLFLASGVLGLLWALRDRSVAIGGVSITLIGLGMVVVRDIRRDAIEAAQAELAAANRASERAQLESSGSE